MPGAAEQAVGPREMSSKRPTRWRAAGRAIVVLNALVAGCSPVYVFELRSVREAPPALDRVTEQLDQLLWQQGFRRVSWMRGADSGYDQCQDAADPAAYEKQGTRCPYYCWVWVHRYTCHGALRFVVSSSSAAERDAAQTQHLLQSIFRSEIESHMLRDTFAVEMLLAGVPLEQVSILPIACRTGMALSTASAGPPSMTVSVPFLAPMSPPDTGASRDSTPFDSSLFAIERAVAGLMVELSTKTSPL